MTLICITTTTHSLNDHHLYILWIPATASSLLTCCFFLTGGTEGGAVASGFSCLDTAQESPVVGHRSKGPNVQKAVPRSSNIQSLLR